MCTSSRNDECLPCATTQSPPRGRVTQRGKSDLRQSANCGCSGLAGMVPSQHAAVRRGHVSRNCESPVAAIDASSLPRHGIQYDDVRPGTWHLNLHNARRARGGIVNIVGDQPTHHRPLDVPLTADSPLWERRNLDVSVVGALMIGAMSRWQRTAKSRGNLEASTVRASRSCRRRLAHEARPLRPRLAKVHRERASGERPCSTTGRRA